jgi:hypothetical protein
MKIDWVSGASIPALVVEKPTLYLGTARVAVRVPHPTKRFVYLVTISMMQAVRTQAEGRIEITERSDPSVLNLQPGDMVMVVLGANDGFPSFVQRRLVDPPAYSVRDNGFRVSHIYEWPCGLEAHTRTVMSAITQAKHAKTLDSSI